MDRWASRTIAVVALTIALALSGCLRNKFDLCDAVQPHPECDAGPPPPRDSGVDAGLDGATEDSGMPLDSGSDDEDSGASDAGSTPDDAGDAVDAGT